MGYDRIFDSWSIFTPCALPYLNIIFLFKFTDINMGPVVRNGDDTKFIIPAISC